jgi:hypothetical protein
MNTNIISDLARSRKPFGRRFLASIREDSRSFVAKILFDEQSIFW